MGITQYLNKNLFLRTVAGIILVTVILFCIWWSIWTFLGLFLLVTILSINEFHKMTNSENVSVINWLAMVSAALLFVGGFVYYGIGDDELLTDCVLAEWIFNDTMLDYLKYSYIGVFIVMFISELFRKGKNPVSNMAYFVLGQIYVAIPFALLNGILLEFGWEPMFLIAMFVTIWFNDSCAYLTGSLFGKLRLFERVSPKKSWEGVIGGAVGALLSGYLFSLFLTDLNLWQWFIFSEIVVVFGTLGDLLESLIKRTTGVKDSGHAIPGHGGMLDRFDSMILITPVILIYLNILF